MELDSTIDSAPAPSVWLEELDVKDKVETLTSLPEYADIVIIGAGMTGTSLAYHLSTMNVSSLVIDSRDISGGASGRNAGMLWPHGEFERWVTDELLSFIEKKNIRDEVLLSEKGGFKLHEVGCRSTKTPSGCYDKDAAELLHANPEYVLGGYKDEDAISFWPAKVVIALARASQPFASYCLHCTVYRIEPHESNSSLQRLITKMGNLLCKKVVVCTNGWIPALLPELAPYIEAVTNTVLCSQSALSNDFTFPVAGISAGYGADEVYMNMRKDGRIILGGLRSKEKTSSNSDFGPGDTNVEEELKLWLQTRFPQLYDQLVFSHSWKGVIGITIDGLPIFGQVPDVSPYVPCRRNQVYVCGGLGGHGMPRCFGLGLEMARLLCGDCTQDEQIKRTRRKSVKKFLEASDEEGEDDYDYEEEKKAVEQINKRHETANIIKSTLMQWNVRRFPLSHSNSNNSSDYRSSPSTSGVREYIHSNSCDSQSGISCDCSDLSNVSAEKEQFICDTIQAGGCILS